MQVDAGHEDLQAKMNMLEAENAAHAEQAVVEKALTLTLTLSISQASSLVLVNKLHLS